MHFHKKVQYPASNNTLFFEKHDKGALINQKKKQSYEKNMISVISILSLEKGLFLLIKEMKKAKSFKS